MDNMNTDKDNIKLMYVSTHIDCHNIGYSQEQVSE